MTPRTTQRAIVGLLVALGVTLSALGGALWTQLVQRKPQIIAVAVPTPNLNADASGVMFQAWSLRGEGLALMDRRALDRSWRPIPAATFKPGQKLWIFRESCYVDKAAVAGVVTELIGQGAAAGRRFAYPPVDPPKRTVPMQTEINGRPTGPVGPLGHCAAFNYPFVLPGAKTRDVNAARALWPDGPSEWILRTSVRFIWTWFLPRVPAYHPDVWITVTP